MRLVNMYSWGDIWKRGIIPRRSVLPAIFLDSPANQWAGRPRKNRFCILACLLGLYTHLNNHVKDTFVSVFPFLFAPQSIPAPLKEIGLKKPGNNFV